MNIYDLRTEYRRSPFGLTVNSPRFSWKMNADKQNTVQNLYRIQVWNGTETVWDTGMKESSD